MMRKAILLLSAAALVLALTPAERLAKWKRVDMPFHSTGLSAGRRRWWRNWWKRAACSTTFTGGRATSRASRS